MLSSVYLDWAATTPPDTEILLDSLRIASEHYANPSSRHSMGLAARLLLEESRTRLLEALDSPDGKLAFTGSGSEADSIPLLSLLHGLKRNSSPIHLVTTSIEHAAVYEQALLLQKMGLRVTFVSPDSDGRVVPEKIAAAMTKDTALVCVMAVNNETGAIQPLEKIVAAVKSAAAALGGRRPHIHADAVQAFGKMPFSPQKIGLTSAAISAHKLRGPRGSGALWYSAAIKPLVVGGGQEGGMRPGTESLQSVLAFAHVAEKAVAQMADNHTHALRLEKRLMEGIAAMKGALILPPGRTASDPAWSPYILSISFPGLSGEVIVRALSDCGISVSTGSACSSRDRGKTRRVLDAMGLAKELSESAIRVSSGSLTTEAEIDMFLEKAGQIYKRLRT